VLAAGRTLNSAQPANMIQGLSTHASRTPWAEIARVAPAVIGGGEGSSSSRRRTGGIGAFPFILNTYRRESGTTFAVRPRRGELAVPVMLQTQHWYSSLEI